MPTGEMRQLLRDATSLRRVATIVAEQRPDAEILEAAVAEVAQIVAPARAQIVRVDADGWVTLLAASGDEPVGIERRWLTTAPTLYDARQGAQEPVCVNGSRMPDTTAVSVYGQEPLTETVPIIVDGKVWGFIAVLAEDDAPPPGGREARLAQFASLIATGIVSTRARDELRSLAKQQEALRRVATLVAQGADPGILFDAVAAEASRLVGVGAVSLIGYTPETQMFRQVATTHGQRAAMPVGAEWPIDWAPLGARIIATEQPTRLDGYTQLPGKLVERHKEEALGQAVGAPIMVEGRLWGYIAAFGERDDILEEGCELRLADFANLIATAISNAQARDALNDLAEQQAGLRRVATLVAQEAEPASLFAAVAAEVAHVIGVGAVAVVAYNAQAGTVKYLAATHGPRAASPLGADIPLDTAPLASQVFHTGQPARVDAYEQLDSALVQRHSEEGFRQSVGAPIVVNGKIWGMIAAFGEQDENLPQNCELRLAAFTNLLATAISNVQARDELRNLAEQQAALRRIATLVAQGAAPNTLFEAVVVEAGDVVNVGAIGLYSYRAASRTVKQLANTHGPRAAKPVGAEWPLDAAPLASLVVETGRPVRVNSYADLAGELVDRHNEEGFGQAVGAPIIVDGEIWGFIAAYGERDEILPSNCEPRLADFTSLVATSISNAQAREELRGLAEKQGAALRRVATLVAEQASPHAIFDAVAAEASHALSVPRVDVVRCHDHGRMTVVGSTGTPRLPSAFRYASGEPSVTATVAETRRPARIDDWTKLDGQMADVARAEGFRSVVGAPIVVDNELWGVIVIMATEILPKDTETRLTDFTHLVASSISNVHARETLMRSRARIVTASDETRRRIERDLHDGVQQRVIALGLRLQAVRERFGLTPDGQDALDLITHELEGVLGEIRAFSRGLHPALLSRAGLGAALRALAGRSPIPVDLDVQTDPRPPEPIEMCVYYVVSEALANAAKHSGATLVSVTVAIDTTLLRAEVIDDGVGGAVANDDGSGLVGLTDRVEAVGGRLSLHSPLGAGTKVSIAIPLAQQSTSSGLRF
jgi:signal transduction histidine kinase/uncharacterized protein YoaH (UPF0181 family)